MSKFRAYRLSEHSAKIEQLSATRDWMDATQDKHAYMCLPLNLTNRLGWGISFDEDLSFIWDGITDTTPDHVKVLEGSKYLSTTRGNATISFNTSLLVKTDSDTTTLTMPVPNLFVKEAQCYTDLISTSFYEHSLPVAWRITEPNVEITIPAGQPVAAILPISLGNLQDNYTLEVLEGLPYPDYWGEVQKYGDALQDRQNVGDWTKMYRDALDYSGKSIGSHEVKTLKLKTSNSCPNRVAGENE